MIQNDVIKTIFEGQILVSKDDFMQRVAKTKILDPIRINNSFTMSIGNVID